MGGAHVSECHFSDGSDDHRHVSHLFAPRPGRRFSPVATPEQANAAGASLRARRDQSTGRAMAWRINFWAGYWTAIAPTPCCAICCISPAKVTT
jgi:hypothetical protein